jgi:ankyrin repeat domain-containing protein 49
MSFHNEDMLKFTLDEKIEDLEKDLKSSGDIDIPRNQMGFTLLQYAAMNGKVGSVQFLLEYGADVNNQKCDGWTALHLAVHNNERECARILLDYGADVHLENKGGSTPLEMAKSKSKFLELMNCRGTNIKPARK